MHMLRSSEFLRRERPTCRSILSSRFARPAAHHFDTGHGGAAKNAERTQAGRRASADRSDTTLGAGASEARNRTLVRPNGTDAGLVGTNPQFNGTTAWGSAEGRLRIRFTRMS